MALENYLPETDFVREGEYDEKRHEALLDMAIELKNKGDPNWRTLRDAADKYERDAKGKNNPGETSSMDRLGAGLTGAAQEFTWGGSDNLAAGAAAIKDMVYGDKSQGTGFLDRYRNKVKDYATDRTIKKTLYPQTYRFGQGVGLAGSMLVPVEEVAGGVANAGGKLLGMGPEVGKLVEGAKSILNKGGEYGEKIGKYARDIGESVFSSPKILNRIENAGQGAYRGAKTGFVRGASQQFLEDEAPITNAGEFLTEGGNIIKSGLQQGKTGLMVGGTLGALDTRNPNLLEAKSASEKAKLYRVYNEDYAMTPDEVNQKLKNDELQSHQDLMAGKNTGPTNNLKELKLRGKPLHEALDTLENKATQLRDKVENKLNNIPLTELQDPAHTISARELIQDLAPDVVEKKDLNQIAEFLDGVNVNRDHKFMGPNNTTYNINGKTYNDYEFTLLGLQDARRKLDDKLGTFRKSGYNTATDLEVSKALTKLRSSLNQNSEVAAQAIGSNPNIKSPGISEIMDDVADQSKVLNSRDIIEEAVHRKAAELSKLPPVNPIKEVAYMVAPFGKYAKARQIEKTLDVTSDDIIRGELPSFLDRFSPTINIPRYLRASDEMDAIKKAMNKYTGDRSVKPEDQPLEWQKKNEEMNKSDLKKEKSYLKGTRLEDSYPDQTSAEKKKKKYPGTRWDDESTDEWLTSDSAAGFRLANDEFNFS